MFSKRCITFVALLFLTAKGDPDPQTFIASTPGPQLPSPSQQPQYEQKNIVVYLTPEQITALQTGQGVLEPVLEPQPQEEDEQQNREQTSQDELEEDIDQQSDFLGNQRFVIVQNQEENEPAPVKESSQERPQGLSRYSSKYRNLDYERNKYYAPTQKLLENNRYSASSTEKSEEIKSYEASSEKPKGLDLKSYNYYSVYNQTKGDNINIKIIHPNAKLREVLGLKQLESRKTPAPRKYKFVSYANVNKKLSDVAPIQESSQRNPSSSQKSNERQYAVLFSPAQSEEQQESERNEQEESSENEQNEDEELNESRQDERKKILDFLKKQNAQAEAENVARRPVLNKKASITKQAPVPKPYIVRVSQPVEVKKTQPYPVPLEIMRRVPIQIEDTEQEVERKADKVETLVRVPALKKVYVKVDKPILVERILPVETRRQVKTKPQKLTILGPTLRYFD